MKSLIIPLLVFVISVVLVLYSETNPIVLLPITLFIAAVYYLVICLHKIENKEIFDDRDETERFYEDEIFKDVFKRKK